MSAVCRFCDREFSNRQAVRAHLKGCDAYQAVRKAPDASDSAPLGGNLPGSNTVSTAREANPTPGPDSDLVRQLEKQVAAGRLKLTLRELDSANAELDRHAEAKQREKVSEIERDAARVRADEAEEQARRGRADLQRRERERREAASRRRREIIQEIKQAVTSEGVYWYAPSPEIKADALREIERDLSGLEVAELPREELLAIARATRNRLYRMAADEEKRARDAELAAIQRAQERAERKHRLIQQAVAYTRRELESVADLSGLERWTIEQRVERELQDIEGDEAWSDIADDVEDILESEGISDDDWEDQ